MTPGIQPSARPTALIVGGTSGIGLSTVGRLQSSGWQVYSAGRTKREVPAGAKFVELDVLSESSVRAAFQKIESETAAGLDAFVYSTGITLPKKTISDFALESWQTLWNTNVTGAILSLKYAYPLLKKTRGKVVLLNSVASRTYSQASSFEYTTSKAALTGLAHQIAIEWANDGILVNSVYPGMTLTPMLESRLTAAEQENFARKSPLGRLLKPDEVAAAIEYLVSSSNTHMTGSALDLNGGLFLT